MLFDIAGHEYFAAAHNAVTLVNGWPKAIIDIEQRSRFSLVLSLAFYSMFFSSVIGAVCALIFKRKNDFNSYLFSSIFVFYSLTLLSMLIFGFGNNFENFSITRFFALFFALCLVVTGFISKRFSFLLSGLLSCLPISLIIAGFIWIIFEFRSATFLVTAFIAIIPIMLALYYKRFRGRDIPMRPVLMFMGAAYALFILPLALEYFGVIS